MVLDYELVELPFISVPARAGIVEMVGPEKDYGLHEKRPMYRRAGEDLRNRILIEVDGDSMEPQLQAGDILLARLIDKGDWPYLSGGVYAVSYANFFVIKRVKNNDIPEGFLHLHSDNPQGGEIKVPVNQIHYIWYIERGVDRRIR